MYDNIVPNFSIGLISNDDDFLLDLKNDINPEVFGINDYSQLRTQNIDLLELPVNLDILNTYLKF